MHMCASERKDWTRPQLGKPRAPLERWVDFGRNRYKDHRNRMHGLQMASKTRMHNSVINGTMPSRMQQETKLLHPNITKKHMAVMYSRCLTKHEHWGTASSHNSRFKQAWQKCKRYQVHRLRENNNMPGFNTRKQCLEQDNNMLQKHIMVKQGMAWNYTKHITKVPYWPWAKKDQKIWWHPCKHSKFR